MLSTLQNHIPLVSTSIFYWFTFDSFFLCLSRVESEPMSNLVSGGVWVRGWMVGGLPLPTPLHPTPPPKKNQ